MKWLEIFPFAGFVVLSILISGRIILLKKIGVKVSSGKNQHPGMKYILYPLFILLFLVWLFELIKPVLGISFSVFSNELTSPLTNHVWLRIAGALLILMSVLFMAQTLHHFKTSLRFGLHEDNRGMLITSGIFSFSRNPFFLSIIIYFVGTALIFMNWFFIGFAALAMVSIHFFILKEEKFMRQHYGESYREYRKKVRRYF